MQPQVNLCSAVGTFLGGKFYFSDFCLKRGIICDLITDLAIHCITFPVFKILAEL